MGCGADHNFDRYKLYEKYVQIELRVHSKQFKKLEKNIFRTIYTVIAHVLGMPKVVLKKLIKS